MGGVFPFLTIDIRNFSDFIAGLQFFVLTSSERRHQFCDFTGVPVFDFLLPFAKLLDLFGKENWKTLAFALNQKGYYEHNSLVGQLD